MEAAANFFERNLDFLENNIATMNKQFGYDPKSDSKWLKNSEMTLV